MSTDSATTGFIAYPGRPRDLSVEIRTACQCLKENHGLAGFTTWEENDIAGRFLIDPILEKITETDVLVADVTTLNFNVAFEIGYAIGSRRRVLLVRRSDIAGDSGIHAELGIFDTLGYDTYTSGASLASKIATKLGDCSPIRLSPLHSSGRPRVFLVQSPSRASYDISLLSTVKKSRVGFENYDPVERGRLPASYAIDCVSRENALVARFLPESRNNAQIHNIRVAFCAGIAHALGRRFLLLQESEEPVPLDYRDLVTWVPNSDDIGKHISTLLMTLFEDVEAATTEPVATETLISKLHVGASIAENESRALSSYYLQTEAFNRALRGEIQAVTGRKGSGKTAFFIELRNSLRRHPNNIILDLQPEGFQLLKFKERCLSLLSEGSREHLLTALWEYVILLEIAFRILRDERTTHVHNHMLNKPYRDINTFLRRELQNTEISDEGDFSERLDRVLQHVEVNLGKRPELAGGNAALSNPTVIEVLHSVDLKQLQTLVEEYVKHKEGVWILVDNLDKGWPATGVTEDDTRIIRCLQSALHKIEKPLRRADVTCKGIVFIRSDVYERVIEATPDKGKTSKVTLDLANRDILREILRLRFAYALDQDDVKLEDLWPRIMVSHVGATADETSDFLIARSLMRPRFLLDLFQSCRSNAVTLGHDKVTEEDLKNGLIDYSLNLAANIGFEIRDVYHEAPDIVYELIGYGQRVSLSKVQHLLNERGVPTPDEFVELLMWYGVLAPVNVKGEARYIYDERYDMRKLKAVHSGVSAGGDPVFEINPAFWAALEVEKL